MIKIYCTNTGEDAFGSEQFKIGILTDCPTYGQFMLELVYVLRNYFKEDAEVVQRGILEFPHPTADLLESIFDIACKMKGYKADSVEERRHLFSGSMWPGLGDEPIISSNLFKDVPEETDAD